MLRISLFVLSLFVLCGFKNDFESKQDAIDYLNNANIWIAGMPEFSIDHDKSMLNIKLTSSAGSVTASIPLDKVKTELQAGETVSIELNCNNGEFCALATTSTTTAETDGLTLVMQSTFDDGTYHDKYVEQGGKIADALDYLISFYAN